MQLSRLLARLTPAERADVIRRRLGSDAADIDNRALANELSRPESVADALSQLNNGQLLLLRWLAGRPNLAAERPELLAALGERLPAELHDAYLRNLRLWALVDFDPAHDDPVVATYPAVVEGLPRRRGVTLRERLSELNSDHLLRMIAALGLKNAPTRKDGRIQLLVDTLTQAEGCRAAVGRLSEAGRELFEWVRAQGGWVGVQQMHDKVPSAARGYGGIYGTADSFWRVGAEKAPADPLTELVRVGLLLAVRPYSGSWYSPSAFAIAEDVELAYSGRTLFDTGPMQPPPMEPVEHVDGVVPNPAHLLRDIAHLLGFVAVGRCEWRQDGQPYKRSLVALGKALGYPDAEYAEALWELAVSAGLVRPARRGQLGYAPVAVGTVTPRQMLDGLLVAWINAGARTTPVGVSHLLGQAARVYLLQLLRLMPTDTWVLRTALETWLRFNWPVLFAPEYQPVHVAAPPDPGWSSMMHMLLGHGTTPDDRAAVMLPAAHQRLLLPEEAKDAVDLPPWDDTWIVQPDRSVVVPPNAHPDALLALWWVAALESNQGASVFRITGQSISAALNRGTTPSEIRKSLEKRSRAPLPPTVERLIDDQGQRYGRIKVGAASTYVKTDDPALLEELRRDAKLKHLDWRDVAPGVAFVVSADPTAVLDSLRRAGHLPVMDKAEVRAPARRAAGRAPGRAGGKGRARSGATSSSGMARQAMLEDRLLVATWVDGGRTHSGELELIDLHGREIHANNLDDGAEVLVPLDSILELALGEPLGDWPDDDE